MPLNEWTGIGAGTLAAAAMVAAARLVLRGGGGQRVQTCRFICPRFDEDVSCSVAQDLRTGQWLGVEECSVFSPPEKLLCGQDCRRLMNLGLLQPRVGPS